MLRSPTNHPVTTEARARQKDVGHDHPAPRLTKSVTLPCPSTREIKIPAARTNGKVRLAHCYSVALVVAHSSGEGRIRRWDRKAIDARAEPRRECYGSECSDAANLCSIAFSRNQKRIRKSLVCLTRSLRTVTSLSISAASVLSRRSVSIWFGPSKFASSFQTSSQIWEHSPLRDRTVSLGPTSSGQ
jgi:hypothetical protein